MSANQRVGTGSRKSGTVNGSGVAQVMVDVRYDDLHTFLSGEGDPFFGSIFFHDFDMLGDIHGNMSHSVISKLLGAGFNGL